MMKVEYMISLALLVPPEGAVPGSIAWWHDSGNKPFNPKQVRDVLPWRVLAILTAIAPDVALQYAWELPICLQA